MNVFHGKESTIVKDIILFLEYEWNISLQYYNYYTTVGVQNKFTDLVFYKVACIAIMTLLPRSTITVITLY